MRPYRGFFSICLSLVDVQPIRLTVQSTDSLPARPSRLSSVRRMHALLWSAMFMVAVSVSAQVPAPTIPDNGLTPASPLGIPPHASTEGTNEKVSLMNGALNLFIPLLSLPQRGGYPLSLGYVHHSNLYSLQQITSVQSSNYEQGTHNQLIDRITYYDSLGTHDSPLEINLPRLQFSIEYMGDYTWTVGTVFNYVNVFCGANFVFTDWEGNKHPFENVTVCNTGYAGHVIPFFQNRNLTDSTDGSYYGLDTSNPADMKRAWQKMEPYIIFTNPMGHTRKRSPVRSLE